MKLGRSLEHIQRRLMHLWIGQASREGLTYSEYEYLRTLESLCGETFTSETHHSQHLQNLVESMGVQKASASAMVVKLEGRGLVERLPCQYDARAQHILLTKQGKKLLREASRVYSKLADRIRSRLNAGEYRRLEKMLAKVSNEI